MNTQRNPWVTQTLITANLLMAVIVYFRGTWDQPLTLIAAGADVPAMVRSGDYWRLLSATFLHGSLMHLLFNMWGLYQLGTINEYIFGKSKYLIIYVLCGLAGSLLSSLFPNYTMSVGASGAVFGLAGSALGMVVRRKNYINPAFKQSMMQGLLPMILFNLFLGFTNPIINNLAHIGGLIGGLLCGYFIYPDVAKFDKKTSPATYFVLGMVLMALIYTGVNMIPNALNPPAALAKQFMNREKAISGISYKYPRAWKRNQVNDSNLIIYISPYGDTLTADKIQLDSSKPQMKLEERLAMIKLDKDVINEPVTETIPNGYKIRYTIAMGDLKNTSFVHQQEIVSGSSFYRFVFDISDRNNPYYERMINRIFDSIEVNVDR